MVETGRWIVGHYMELGAIALAILGLGEMIVRLTPTEKDDGLVERFGFYIRKALDFLRIPNVKK